MDNIGMRSIRGFVRAFVVTNGVGVEHSKAHNLVLYDWAPVAVANLLNRPDGKSYHVNGMYIEFANVGASVGLPTYGRGDATEYYDNLNTSDGTRDYLRVPLIAASGSNSNNSNFSANNVATFYAQTQGATGVHSLDFSSGDGSYVYGGALVVAREWGDASQDLIFSRVYFSAPAQIPKAASSQIGLTWEITCD